MFYEKTPFFILLIIFFSCGEKKDNNALSIFKYNESAGINSLDPAFSKDQASVWAVSQLFNGLVQLDSNLNINPCIAKSWIVSPNSLVYKFILRDDVFFHDHKNFKDSKGRKVTAYDFEFSFSRILDNDIASPGRWVFTNVDSFKAINDSSFIIKLKKPFPGFLGLLTMQYCSVVPKEITTSIDFHANPIGTGPFKFQLWQQMKNLVFRKTFLL